MTTISWIANNSSSIWSNSQSKPWHLDTDRQRASWLDRSHGLALLWRGSLRSRVCHFMRPMRSPSRNSCDRTKAWRSALAFRSNHCRRCCRPGATSGRARPNRCGHHIALADTGGRSDGAHGMVSFPRTLRSTDRPWYGVSRRRRRSPLMVGTTHAIESLRAARNYRRMCRLRTGQQSDT
jgi:hypothetical protein